MATKKISQLPAASAGSPLMLFETSSASLVSEKFTGQQLLDFVKVGNTYPTSRILVSDNTTGQITTSPTLLFGNDTNFLQVVGDASFASTVLLQARGANEVLYTNAGKLISSKADFGFNPSTNLLSLDGGIALGSGGLDSLSRLDINDSTKGARPFGRGTNGERLELAPTADGLLYYDTTLHELFIWQEGKDVWNSCSQKEFVILVNLTGAITVSNAVIRVITLGRIVHLAFLDTQPTAVASATITAAAGSLPTDLWPEGTTHSLFYVVDNGVVNYGTISLDTAGGFEIGLGPTKTAFSGTGQTGFIENNISYRRILL